MRRFSRSENDKGTFVVAKELVNSLAETLGWESVEVLKEFRGILNWYMTAWHERESL